MTFNARGNTGISNNSLATGANTTFVVDASAKIRADIQVEVTFGTVGSPAGLEVCAYRRFATSNDDNNPFLSFVVPAAGSTSQAQSFTLPTGKYLIRLRNLDGSNGVTGVYGTTSTVDSYT